jgi:hypothetical protein
MASAEAAVPLPTVPESAAAATIEVSARPIGRDRQGSIWEEAVDPGSGSSYYVNTDTNQSTWERPQLDVVVVVDQSKKKGPVSKHAHPDQHLSARRILEDIAGEFVGEQGKVEEEEVKSLRYEVNEFLESRGMQIFLICLAILEIAVLQIELIIARDEDYEAVIEVNDAHAGDVFHTVLHSTSTVVLSIFTLEALLSIWALRCEYFHNPLLCFDLIAVILPLVLNTSLNTDAFGILLLMRVTTSVPLSIARRIGSHVVVWAGVAYF